MILAVNAIEKQSLSILRIICFLEGNIIIAKNIGNLFKMADIDKDFIHWNENKELIFQLKKVNENLESINTTLKHLSKTFEAYLNL